MAKFCAFVGELYSHWQAAWLGTVSIIIAIYLSATGHGNLTWGGFAVFAFICFFIAAFQVWNEKEKRIAKQGEETEAVRGWESLAKKFKDLDDGAVLIARWHKNLSDGTRTWEIQGYSLQMQNISTEIIKMAGKRLLTSRVASAPLFSPVADDRDRWLEAMVKVLGVGKVETEGHVTIKGMRTDLESGVIKNLTGESQRMCLRLLNEETAN